MWHFTSLLSAVRLRFLLMILSWFCIHICTAASLVILSFEYEPHTNRIHLMHSGVWLVSRAPWKWQLFMLFLLVIWIGVSFCFSNKIIIVCVPQIRVAFLRFKFDWSERYGSVGFAFPFYPETVEFTFDLLTMYFLFFFFRFLYLFIECVCVRAAVFSMMIVDHDDNK